MIVDLHEQTNRPAVAQNSALGVAAAGICLPGTQAQDLKARVDVFEESIVLTLYEGRRPRACHEVDPADLAVAFSGVPLTTDILPAGCLCYTRRNGQVRLAVYVPPQPPRPVTVANGAGRRTYQVPLPPLVFLGQGLAYAIWAVKERPRPGQHTQLYQAPFPNVHRGGGICRGNMPFPQCGADTIHAAWQAFLESDFNDHLVQGKSEAYPENVVDLWAHLDSSGAPEYPLDDLVCRYYGTTLRDFLRGGA